MRDKLYQNIEKLTKRENNVLEYLVLGFDNEEIARELGITIHTVKDHVSHIIKKFHAKNRVHVAFIAGAGDQVEIR